VLSNAKLVAFAATTNGDRAATFYRDVLGLTVNTNDEFALSLAAGDVELRVQKVAEFRPQSFTSLGWQVADIASVVAQLGARGVVFERYPWLEQDAAGIWRAPSGAQVAWFRDPDGNLLSIAQYPD